MVTIHMLFKLSLCSGGPTKDCFACSRWSNWAKGETFLLNHHLSGAILQAGKERKGGLAAVLAGDQGQPAQGFVIKHSLYVHLMSYLVNLAGEEEDEGENRRYATFEYR